MALESTEGNNAYPYNIFMASVPVPTAFADTKQKHPASKTGAWPGKSAFFAASGSTTGFIFVTMIDASSSVDESTALWKASFTSSGVLSDWTAMPDLPTGTDNQRGDIFVARDTLFVVRGSKVFGADLDESSGAMGSWKAMPDLPELQIDVTWSNQCEGQSYGIIKDYVYVTGQKAVHYAKIQPVPCGAE